MSHHPGLFRICQFQGAVIFILSLGYLFPSIGLHSAECKSSPLGITIVESGEHFFSSEIVTRTIRLRGISPAHDDPRFLWRLMAGGALLGEGTGEFLEASVSVHEATFVFRCPTVERIVSAILAVQVLTDGMEPISVIEEYRIYPKPSKLNWSFLAGKDVGVFDPSGVVRSHFKEEGIEVNIIPFAVSIQDFRGDLVVIGPGALDTGPIREFVFGRPLDEVFHAPTLVLAQHLSLATGEDRRDGGLPDALGQRQFEEIAAPRRPFLRSFVAADFHGWRGEEEFAPPGIPWPRQGNCRRLLLDSASNESHSASVLESFTPLGVPMIQCQLRLLATWDTEPVSRPFMHAILQHLVLNPQVEMRSGLAILGSPESTTLDMLTKTFLGANVGEGPTNNQEEEDLEKASCLIVEGVAESVEWMRTNEAYLFQEAIPFVHRGGALVLAGLDENGLEAFRGLLGDDITLEDEITQEPYLNKPHHPLLWGITESDWEHLAPHAGRRLVGRNRLVLNDEAAGEILIEPGWLGVLERGDGKVLLCQVNLEDSSPSDVDLVFRQLLTNLGILLETITESMISPSIRW